MYATIILHNMLIEEGIEDDPFIQDFETGVRVVRKDVDREYVPNITLARIAEAEMHDSAIHFQLTKDLKNMNWLKKGLGGLGNLEV